MALSYAQKALPYFGIIKKKNSSMFFSSTVMVLLYIIKRLSYLNFIFE